MCCIVKCCNCHILLAVDMAGVACQGLGGGGGCMCVEVGKNIGITICKVSFLPCLVAFWGFYPYMFFHFFFMFFCYFVF